MLTSPFIRSNRNEKKTSPFSSLKSYYGGNIIAVKPYYRGSGSLVKTHLRTKPDGLKINNLSFGK